MIGPRDDSDGDASPDAASPWATGEIDAAPPAEIEWSTTPGPLTGEDADPVVTGAPNRLGVVAGAVAAAVVVFVAVALLWPSGDGPSDDASDPDAAPTTLGTLPESDDDEAVTTTRPGSDDGDGVREVLDLPRVEGGPLPQSMELPSVLAAVEQPTEIVMSTERGLATLSVPSGRIRYAIVGDGTATGGNPLVVSPEATAVTNAVGQLTVVPRDGPPIVVSEFDQPSGASDGAGGFDGFYLQGWTTGTDGRVYFQVVAFDNSGEQTFLVDTQGRVGDGAPISLETSFRFDVVRSNGRTIINEAGGVYVVETDGTPRRIAIGRALAANGEFVLLRECDDVLRCRLVVVDLAGGRRVVEQDVEVTSPWSFDLAPDGDAISTVSPGSDGFQDAVRIVDLTTGSVTGEMIAGPAFFNPGSAWLADGSGVVQANPVGGGLTFLDRSSGTAIEFGEEELGRVISIGLRYPDAELPASAGPVTVTDLDLAPGLELATGLNLVVLGSLGNMALLDLDGGTVTAWGTPSLSNRQPPQLFAVGDTLVALGRADGFTSVVGSAEPIDTESVDIPRGRRVRGPDPGQVWVRREDATDEVDHVLVPARPDLPLPGSPSPAVSIPDVSLLGGDGLGGLVVDGAGGVFVATADARSRLTTGDLLALGRNHALVRECDEQLTCRTRAARAQHG